MGAQRVADVYRTAEHGSTFRTAYYLSYYGSEVTAQGISGKFTIMCAKELVAFFVMAGIKTVRFTRVKHGKARMVEVDTEQWLRRLYR